MRLLGTLPLAWFFTVLAHLALPAVASAHSASDAYLTLTTNLNTSTGKISIHGQWDIALRDLEFVLKLDTNGDGRVSWGEVRQHAAAIESYAYQSLRFDSGSKEACSLKPREQMIDEHADGAYAALFFDVICAGAPKKLTLNYKLFFTIDPSHRGIFVMSNGANIATALLSPQNSKIELTLTQ